MLENILLYIALICCAIIPLMGLMYEVTKDGIEEHKKDNDIVPSIKDKLLYIYSYFATSSQADKLKEEVNEFLEAIERGDRTNQNEELADILVVLMQYMYFYEIDTKEVEKVFFEKVDRTINRIETGYYNK